MPQPLVVQPGQMEELMRAKEEERIQKERKLQEERRQKEEQRKREKEMEEEKFKEETLKKKVETDKRAEEALKKHMDKAREETMRKEQERLTRKDLITGGGFNLQKNRELNANDTKGFQSTGGIKDLGVSDTKRPPSIGATNKDLGTSDAKRPPSIGAGGQTQTGFKPSAASSLTASQKSSSPIKASKGPVAAPTSTTKTSATSSTAKMGTTSSSGSKTLFLKPKK
eukprot:TRINITY_DN11783_c0_g1_i8.p1 TRINITY_DN11783_c0_g1~~TRINITY_DN11783_c0_g1_i8.p1  ORF type:complete len:226 (+),score=63.76 TRINITY_DN11783_c0_g1_i8:679-1356(+)